MKLFIYFFALVVPAYSNVDLLRQGNDYFTTQMFQNVVRNSPDQNVVISAFSVLSPLAQLCLASVGPSHDELLRAIGLPNENVIQEQFSNLTNHLQHLNSVELHLANKIYIRPYESLNPRFAATSKDVFNSEFQNVDFSRQNDAADIINSWVEQKTNHRIKELVSPGMLSADTAAVLVNALYFKGDWVNKFDQLLSITQPFYVSEGRTINIWTMAQQSGFHYGESVELDAKLLRMYFKGYNSSFLIILPNKIGLGSLIANLRDSTAIPRAVSNMQYVPEVYVRMPVFKIETTTDLRNVLTNMNIVKLFIPGQARLERLLNTRSDLSISSAVQKAYIDLNENGVEAAAANAFMMSAGMAGGYKRENKSFIADRPFYFGLLIDNMIVFSGVFTH